MELQRGTGWWPKLLRKLSQEKEHAVGGNPKISRQGLLARANRLTDFLWKVSSKKLACDSKEELSALGCL